MKVVLDANVFIAAFLKNSTVREILSSDKYEFYMPEYALEEIERHKDEILKKADISEEESVILENLLLQNIEIVPFEKIKEHIKKAEKIMGEIDLEDSPFIACALALRADGIWTFDKDFKKQDRIKTFSTGDLTE
jgi:predicted nucleic acid-binding protein